MGSYVKLTAHQGRAMARATLDRVKADQERLIAKAVTAEQDRTERWAKTWLGRLLGWRRMTEEEARAAVLADPWFEFEVRLVGWRAEDVAKDLLIAASRADPIRVSVDDLAYLDDLPQDPVVLEGMTYDD